MSSTFRFSLPRIELEVTPVLRIGGSSATEREILLFSFGPATATYRDDPSFAWSTSLDSLFRYATPQPDEFIVRTKPFTVTSTLSELSITPHRWAGSPPSSVVDIALESMTEEVPLVILAERSAV